MISPTKILEIEGEVATHRGVLKKLLTSGEVDEAGISTADETHFVINMDSGMTLGFRADRKVKWADLVSGREGMTMDVHSSGDCDAKIERNFMIFDNKGRSTLICGIPDDVDGTSYKTGAVGCIN